MSKHTPGPWRFGGPEKCTIYDRFGQRIANSFEGVMATQRSDSECQANAKLIASAPDLLEALQAIIEDMDSEHGTEYDYNKARAAIKKATE